MRSKQFLNDITHSKILLLLQHIHLFALSQYTHFVNGCEAISDPAEIQTIKSSK